VTTWTLLLFQLAATSGPLLPDASTAPTVSQRDCAPDARQIVVCAKDRDTYRLPKTGPAIEAPLLPKAEWRLFGDAKMGVHGEERSVGGWSAPAAMATITVPF
jgi:hypothetical protein